MTHDHNSRQSGGARSSQSPDADKPALPLEKILEATSESVKHSGGDATKGSDPAGDEDLRSSAAKVPGLQGEQIPVNQPLDETVADLTDEQADQSRRS